VSRYVGEIRLRIRLASGNGYEADQNLAQIAAEIQESAHKGIPRDDDGEIDEDEAFGAAFYIVTGYTVGQAEPD
jgi:hypothetical protein